MSKTHKKLLILLSCVLVIVAAYLYIRPSKTYKLAFGIDGFYFLESGWFKNGEYKIEVKDGRWGWYQPDGYWTEIATPYEEVLKKGNWDLVLEPGGRAYQIRKDRLERMELKNMNKDWYQYDSKTGQWYKIDWNEY